MDEFISKQVLKDLGAECIAKRNIRGNLIPLGSIDSLPSASTEKTGQWIDEGWYAEGHSEHAYRCSECDEHYIGYVGEYKYCPNCGTKMKEEEA